MKSQLVVLLLSSIIWDHLDAKSLNKRSFGFLPDVVNSGLETAQSSVGNAVQSGAQLANKLIKAVPVGWENLLAMPADVIQASIKEMEQLKDFLDKWLEGDLRNINDGRGKEGPVLAKGASEDTQFLWKDGTVPYDISNDEVFTAKELQVIKDAMKDIMAKTCVKFVERNGEEDYISFVKGKIGCSSDVARMGGRQTIDLQPGCIKHIGEVQHEILHSLGFYHEQSRQDRDEFVDIIWDNIDQDKRNQFDKYVSFTQSLPYDYESVMHYGFNYFAKDIKKPSILPKKKATIGNRKVLSDLDVKKIRKLYSCA